MYDSIPKFERNVSHSPLAPKKLLEKIMNEQALNLHINNFGTKKF